MIRPDEQVPRLVGMLALRLLFLSAFLLPAISAPATLAASVETGDAKPSPSLHLFPFDRWVTECSKAQGLRLRVLRFVSGGIILTVAVEGGDPLAVELNRASRGAFREVGGVGLTPIGEFNDWGTVSPDLRSAFEGLSACVKRSPIPELPMGEITPHAAAPGKQGSLDGIPLAASHGETKNMVRTQNTPGMNPVRPVSKPFQPWLLWAAAMTALALAWRRLRRVPLRQLLTTAGALLGLTAMTYLVRRWVLPFAFFHQNGQGPWWVAYTLGNPSSYGPGYGELFAWLLPLSPKNPTTVVFQAQAILGALAPASVWVMARGIGASRLLSWSLALIVAADPCLARLSQSESYFASTAHLLLAAGALLATGLPLRGERLRLTNPTFLLGILSAGLLVAQLARVHPVAWISAAMIPLVVLAWPAPPRQRFIATAAAMLGIGYVTAVLSGGAIMEVLSGTLGRKWAPGGTDFFQTQQVLWSLFWTALLALAMVLLSRDRLDGAIRGATLLVLILVLEGTNLTGAVNPVVYHAYQHLALAPALAVLAGISLVVPRPPWGEIVFPILMFILAATLALPRLHDDTVLPTDVLEQSLFLEWQAALPNEALVVYLGRTDYRCLFLPIYGKLGVGGRVQHSLRPGETLTWGLSFGGRTFYYRSSLCSTPQGRSTCEKLEANIKMKALGEAKLPARRSMPKLDYDKDPVKVGLYMVETKNQDQ